MERLSFAMQRSLKLEHSRLNSASGQSGQRACRGRTNIAHTLQIHIEMLEVDIVTATEGVRFGKVRTPFSVHAGQSGVVAELEVDGVSD